MDHVNSLQEINRQIYFIGTMHIAAESSRLVEETIELIKPNCVMLELDHVRLKELMTQNETPVLPPSSSIEKQPDEKEKMVGKSSLLEKSTISEKLFEFLHQFQHELGKIMGLTPGVEMVAAFKSAQKFNVDLRLIDRPIMETFQRMKSLEGEGLKEQEKMLETLQDGSEGLEKLDLEELIQELKQPGAITEIIAEFTREYPNIADLLIHERNEYMGHQIVAYLKDNPQDRVMVVLGAGHIQEVMELTENALFPKNRKT